MKKATRASSIFRGSLIKKAREIPMLYVQIFLLAAGITMAILGILRGETLEILRKAIVICLECIGIG